MNFEVLLPDVCEDFCALSLGKQMHVVCQDKNGSILYLFNNGETWHKSTLLESKSAAPYPKHFTLVPVGNYINLFYVIAYKEKYMLVHQILNAEDKPPTVIDHIFSRTPPFIAVPHVGTDITVLYENDAGSSGTRLYRWSRKEFGRFVPVNPAAGCFVRGLMIEPNDRVRYASLKTVESVKNLVYFEKNAEGDYSEPITVYLDCPEDAVPIFCVDGKKLYLVWKENGSIMSSYSMDDGVKWSKPIRYLKNASLEPVLYTIWENERCRHAYGYVKDHDIVLYASPALSVTTAGQEKPRLRPAGYEAEDFARDSGAYPESKDSEKPAPDPMAELLREEMTVLKDQLLSLRLELHGLSERLDRLETVNTSPEAATTHQSKDAANEILLHEEPNGGIIAQSTTH